MLFGRQTDREARLEVMGVAADEAPAVKEFLAELAGDTIDPQDTEKVAGFWSASQRLLRPAWQPPQGAARNSSMIFLPSTCARRCWKRWPNVKLGVLNGRSPREAAGDEAAVVPLLATITVLEYWSSGVADTFDFK